MRLVALLDLRRLSVLRAVVITGFVHAGAEGLSCSTLAVSRQLAVLGRKTGLVLFERVVCGVAPTAAARALADEASRLLVRVAESETLVADLCQGRTEAFSVACFASVSAARLPAAVDRLLHEFPATRVELRLEDDIPTQDGHRANLQLISGAASIDPGAGFSAHHLREES